MYSAALWWVCDTPFTARLYWLLVPIVWGMVLFLAFLRSVVWVLDWREKRVR